MGESKAAIINLERHINNQQTQLNDLQKKQIRLNRNKLRQKRKITEQINASYRLGRKKKVKILLNQENPQKLSRSFIYADYFNRVRLKSIQQFRKIASEIEQITPAIERKAQSLLADKKALIVEQYSLKSMIKNRSKAITAVRSSIHSNKARLAKLQQDQKELEALLKSVEITVHNIKLPRDAIAFSKMKGKLPRPSAGTLDARFGRKYRNMDLRWKGIAFLAKAGSRVTAVHHGRIVFADWFRGKGLLLIIDHGGGYMSLYAHNQSLLRKAGDWVSANEQIATLGNSGGLDHNELYFEIRKKGEPQNPKRWLR